jgi:hypothetical protein
MGTTPGKIMDFVLNIRIFMPGHVERNGKHKQTFESQTQENY